LNATDYAKNSQNQYQWAKELIPKLKLKEMKPAGYWLRRRQNHGRSYQSACQTA